MKLENGISLLIGILGTATLISLMNSAIRAGTLTSCRNHYQATQCHFIAVPDEE